MIGAIVGDIVGSRFEWNNNKSKSFDFLDSMNCYFTDDSVMTLAIGKSLLECKNNYNNLADVTIKNMVELGRKYPDCGFGGKFYSWIMTDEHLPYNSYGNGAAMRVSACGIVANSVEDAIKLSRIVTEISHNHPEGLKGAEAVAVAIYLAKSGKSIIEIRDYIVNKYYDLDFKLDDIRDTYSFNETCQGSVPQALEAFFESNSFEDAIRNAVSIGGDSDTIAAIAGSIAAAYYGVPSEIRKKTITFLDQTLLQILMEFEKEYPAKIEYLFNDNSVSFIQSNNKDIIGDSREELIEAESDAIDFDDNERLTVSEKVSSHKLYNHLYEACNILRGPINQDEYKSYVIPLLFFKRLCDVYDEETEEALLESGGDEEYASFDEQHSFIIPKGHHWNDVRNTTENVGKAIVDSMIAVERENPDTLSGLFVSFDDANWTDKTKLSDSRLKDLIEHMSRIKVGNKNYSADVMGDAYEMLLKKFADLSKKNAGEFYTPRPIVKLMVDILDPKAGETVYDPACGTGGMLIEAIKHMNNNNLTFGKIYGQENNLSTSAIARMNLFLHGARDFKITQGDTLRSPNYLDKDRLKKFDCVIANPPFSLKDWGMEQFSSDIYGRNIWGCPNNSSADYAWVQHMISSMDDKNGRCAVVLSQGVLFHGNKEAKIRESLIKSDKIECIINLVQGIFFSTAVSACIMILNNNKPIEHRGKVLLINASTIYTPKRAQNILEEKDIDLIEKLYRDYSDTKKYSKVVTIEDIKNNNYVLSMDDFIEGEKITLADNETVKQELLSLIYDVKKTELELSKMLSEEGFINE